MVAAGGTFGIGFMLSFFSSENDRRTESGKMSTEMEKMKKNIWHFVMEEFSPHIWTIDI